MLDPAAAERILAGISPAEAEAAIYDWEGLWARKDQLAPPGNWRTWALCAGRGAGKTRSAAEWLRGHVESGRHAQLLIVAPTFTACRQICIEGPSGILSVSPPWARPNFEPSNHRLIWPNGAVAWMFGSEDADRLRGPNASLAWIDEFASCENLPALWTNLNLAVRVAGPGGAIPQICLSTTPKPIPLFREILADPSTVVTRSRTFDNAKHLDASALNFYVKSYGGTSLGRQELEGELVEDNPGALWSRALIERSRVTVAKSPRWFDRVVTAIDPSISFGPDSDECGIVCCGKRDDEAYVIADASGRLSPERWARKALDLHLRHLGDCIVYESNVGGRLVESVIRQYDRSVRVRAVHAKKGKQARAEPVLSLFEQGRVHLIGSFPQLEDELCGWEPDTGAASPNRLDAMCYALTELMIRPRSTLLDQRREGPR